METMKLVGEFMTVLTIVIVVAIGMFLGFMYSHTKENSKNQFFKVNVIIGIVDTKRGHDGD